MSERKEALMDTFRLTSGCISSEQTDDIKRCEAVLALGEKIAKELELHRSTDTLGRWMSHYLAEKIQDARSSGNEVQAEKKKECVELILELWKHRRNFPNGVRPFEDLEPISEVIQSLSTDSSRYFPFSTDSKFGNLPKKVLPWLRAAQTIDSSAMSLVSYCVESAIEQGLDKSKEWLDAARPAVEHEAQVMTIQSLVSLGTKEKPQTRAGYLLKKVSELERVVTQVRKNLEKVRKLKVK
jgi:hypothetical protein